MAFGGIAIETFSFAPLRGSHHPVLVAVTIGLSVMLAATVAGGFALLVARVKATTALMEDVSKLRGRINAAKGSLAVIHKFRDRVRRSV
jgi:hypothetical protein